MEKKDLQLDSKFHVPLCYVKFFEKGPAPTPDSDELDSESKPDSKSSKPDSKNSEAKQTIKIQVVKEKNKFNTVATIPDKIKLPQKELNKFVGHLRNLFSGGASVKGNKISLSGQRPKELQKEIKSYFELDDSIEFSIAEMKIPVKSEFKIFIQPDEQEVIVTWKQRGSPPQIEDMFLNQIKEVWEIPENLFSNNSTHNEAKFVIQGVSIDAVRNYFMNKYSILLKQIEILEQQYQPEPKVRQELIFEYRNPLSLLSTTFTNPRNNFFYENSRTIIDLYSFQKEQYQKKKFYENLTFKRVPDKKGRNKWSAEINARKVFNIDQIQSGYSLKENDLVYVTFQEKMIRGKIFEINKENGLVTAHFILETGKKPPGMDDDDDSEEEIRPNEEEEEKNEQKYLEFFEKNQNDDDDDDENNNEEETINEAEEEFRLKQLLSQNKELLENDIDEDYNDKFFPDQKDGSYMIYFEKEDNFYEKCALGLLSLHDYRSDSKADSFQLIKNMITLDGSFDDQNKSDRTMTTDEVSVDLTDSEFLSETDKTNPYLLQKLVINPTREEKKCVEMVLSNYLSVIHGPPGTGKTYLIGLLIYHLLKKSRGEKMRILLCAKSNQAVENMAKFVSPIVRAMGKKMIWLAGANKTFENLKQFNEANEEERNLLLYQIMKRKTSEGQKYKKLQEEKWRFNELVKKAKKNYYTDEIPKFPSQKLRDMNEIKNTIESNLVTESDVVCCTISTSAKWNISHSKYDVVIIDEAQQATEFECLVPLIHQPNKLILLGDSKQLETYINRKIVKKHPNSANSLYKKFMKKRVPSQSLSLQFRMNSLIWEFPNDEFYSEKVQTAPNVDKSTTYDLPFINTPIVFVNVPKGYERRRRDGTFINITECYVIQKILTNLRVCQIPGSEVGVITPYLSQSVKLNRILAPLKYKGLKVSTIQNFQGCERDFIILSLVRAVQGEIEDFTFQPEKNQLNVALTRARKGLIIVGKFSTISNNNWNKNQYLIDLCDYYQEKNRMIKNSIINDDEIELLKHFVKRPVKYSPLVIRLSKKDKKDDDDNDDVFGDNNRNVGPAAAAAGKGLEKIDDFIDGGNDKDDKDDDFAYDYDDDDDNANDDIDEGDDMFDFDDN